MKNEEYSRPQLNRIRLVESLFRGSAVRNSTGQAFNGASRRRKGQEIWNDGKKDTGS